ncbi:MAG: hypothetical protein PHR52_13005 [Fermentimonas sp.]|nr:hypothetical protein [Fermentimonas sp.]
MRSKETLENEKPSFFHYDLVKKAIYDLYPMRTNMIKTLEYFSNHLFADARYRASKEKFEPREGEVDKNIVANVRTEIFNTIMQDESFIFVHNCIILGDNFHGDSIPLKGYEPKTLDKNTDKNINEVIRNYKEDYPKNSLCKYLTDKDNKEYHENSIYYLKKSNSWWIKAFNLAYKVFDRIRVETQTTSEAIKIVEEINTGDEVLDTVTRDIICYMSANYSYDTTEEQKIMLGMLSCLIKNKYQEPENIVDMVCENDEDEAVGGMTCSQQTKGLLLLFDALGVNEGNTKKIELAKLIQLFTGKNLRNIQNRMKIDFERPKDVSDLKLLSAAFRETFPDISKRIDNDFKPDI